MSSFARRFAPFRADLHVAVPDVVRTSHLLAVGAAVVAVVVALAAIRPTLGPPLAYDTFASVLHFDRIVSGRQLEAALGTTPKPLLTLALGLAHAAGGWVLVSLVSIVAWATAVGLGTALATRLAGIAGGAAMAALLVASPALLLETGWGLASTWALGLWFAAGLVVVAPRPRWGLAGLLLGAATLARLETLLLVGLAIGLLLVRRVAWDDQARRLRPWRSWGLRVGRPRARRIRLAALVPPGPWRIGFGLVALPVMLVHDALLTSDPFYCMRVSAAYGDALASVGALPDAWSAARQVMGVPLGLPVLSILAVLGVLALVRRRAWSVLLALVALGPGMGAFLIVLAATGRFADPRYLVPIQAVILVAAAVGIGFLASVAAARLGRAWGGGGRPSPPERAAALGAGPDVPVRGVPGGGVPGRAFASGALVLVGAGVAFAASPAIGPLDAPTQATLARFQALARSADVAEPVLRQELAGFLSARRWPGTAPLGDRTRMDIFSVPGNLRARLALDLDVPLTRLIATDPAHLDPSKGSPDVGQVVLHSGGDVPASSYAGFEIDGPSSSGPVLLVPLLHDAADATWVVRLETSGGSHWGAQSKR